MAFCDGAAECNFDDPQSVAGLGFEKIDFD